MYYVIFYKQFLSGLDYHNFLLSLNFLLDYDKLFVSLKLIF